MGLSLELFVLLLIQLLAHTFFVQFEIGTHPLKRIMKWGVDPFRATPKKRYYAMRGWKW